MKRRVRPARGTAGKKNGGQARILNDPDGEDYLKP